MLGAYKFEPYKEQEDNSKTPRKKLARISLLDPERITSAASMERGAIRGDAVCLARTCGNHPPNFMTPTQLVREARQIGRRRRLTVRVLEGPELEKMGMGMLMGVARGSRQPPKLIVLEHRPRGAKGTLAFVGKGITFDSGGISLKPGQAMDEMKFDMCGAAAVLGAMDGIGAAQPKVNVVGVVPACENLPDGNSLKPGDILKSYSGKHVEILNTDAEGRLILGDALAYTIATYKPDGDGGHQQRRETSRPRGGGGQDERRRGVAPPQLR
jgi:leucyl aminopeptidase